MCTYTFSHILGWISAGGEAALYAGPATRIEIGSNVGLGVGA